MANHKMIVLQVDLSEDKAKIKEYLDYHKNVWPEVIQDLKDRPIKRMRIFNSGNRLTMLLEVSHDFDINKGIHMEPPSQKVKEWSTLMSSFLKDVGDNKTDEWAPIDLAFDTQDYF